MPSGQVVPDGGAPVAKLSRLQRRILVQSLRAIRHGEQHPEMTGPGRIYDPAAGLLWQPSWELGATLDQPWTPAQRVSASRALARLVTRGLMSRNGRRVQFTSAGVTVCTFR